MNLVTAEKISLQALGQWLAPMAVLPGAPPRSDMKAVCSVILLAVDDMPAALLTQATMREALRTFKFWPTPAEVRALLQPAYNDARDSAYRVPPAARLLPPSPKHTEAEIEHVAAAVKALKADMAAEAADRERLYREARPAVSTRRAPVLSRATLNALYAAKGLKGPQVPADAD